MSRGAMIVIDGPPSVGKTTQLKALYARLQAGGCEVQLLKDADARTDAVTKDLGRVLREQAPAMTANTELLVALAARAQAQPALDKLRQDGVICLVESSYLSLLADLYYGRQAIAEYELLNQLLSLIGQSAAPDSWLVLDAPVQTLLARRPPATDAAKVPDSAYLERVRTGYLWEAKQRQLTTIFTEDAPETITETIWQQLQASLPEPPAATPAANPSDEPVAIGAIIRKKQGLPASDLLQTLQSQLLSQAKDCAKRYNLSAEQVRQISPVSALAAGVDAANAWANVDAASDTTQTHGAELSQQLRLTQRTPLNELESVGFALQQSLASDQSAGTAPSYEAKVQFLQSSDQPTFEAMLASITYHWQITAEYASLLKLHTDYSAQLSWRPLTPRNGFTTPAELEKQGEAAADAYADRFDTSLIAYSQLQAAGRQPEAQQVTLGGHWQSCRVTFTGKQLYQALHAARTAKTKNDTARLDQLLTSIQAVHPLLGEAIAARA